MSSKTYVPKRVLDAARTAGFLKEDGSPNAAAYIAFMQEQVAPKSVRVPRYSPSKDANIRLRSRPSITQKNKRSLRFATRRKRIAISSDSSRRRSSSESETKSKTKSAVNEEHPKHVEPFNQGYASDERRASYRVKRNPRPVVPEKHKQSVRRKLLDKLLVERVAFSMEDDTTDYLTALSAKPALSEEDERLVRKELNRIHSIGNSD